MKNTYLVTKDFKCIITIVKDEDGMELYTTLDVLDEDVFINGDIKSFYKDNNFERFALEMEVQRNPDLQEVSFKDILEYLLKKESEC